MRQMLVGLLVMGWALPMQVFADTGYPEQVRQNFITACVSSCKISETTSPHVKTFMQDYCQCALEQVEKTISFNDYLQWEFAIQEGRQTDPSTQKRFDAATQGCLP